MATGVKCPHCGGHAWQKGFVPTTKGKKPRYICTECGKSFFSGSKPAGKPKHQMSDSSKSKARRKVRVLVKRKKLRR